MLRIVAWHFALGRRPSPQTGDAAGLRVASEGEQLDPVSRAYQLARAGCSDAEVAAVLVAEAGFRPEQVTALIGEPAMAARLEQERLAGRGILRDYVYRAAVVKQPTAASLQQASWLSRQMLGYTTGGVDEEAEQAARDLDAMDNEELADYFESQAAEIRGVEDLADYHEAKAAELRRKAADA